VNADDFSPAGRKQIVTVFGAADIDLPYITLGEEFMWLCYRCFVSRGQESIPLFGQYSLTTQLGSVEYSRPGASGRCWISGWEWFEQFGRNVRPQISGDGQSMKISHGTPVLPSPEAATRH